MSGRDALGLAAVVILYVGTLGAVWLVERRAKKRIRQEKMGGRLPARRSPATPASKASPILWATHILFWVLLPVLAWFVTATAVRLLTPPAARSYLPPHPPFSQAIRWNLNWWLLWAAIAVVGWVLIRLGDALTRWLADPALSRAEELVKAGNFDGAVRALREAIDADGPSVSRWNALAEVLMKQERWSEALKVSLDIEEEWSLDRGNRRRKALALCKLGLPEVALSQLNRSKATTGQRLAEVCAYCQALVTLGLFDRAWDQLRRAEVMYGRGTIPESELPQFREQIDACRARLAEHFADEKPNGLGEL
jgi:tetratricopeptide (TPR) repeat protein